MIQEVWGMNKSLTITAEIFANAGNLVVLTTDLYKGKCATNREESKALKEKLVYDEGLAIVEAAGKYLKSKGCKKVGLVGFCMGGGITIATCCTSKVFDAAVAFYGIPDLNKYDVSKISCPLRCEFAETDQSPVAGPEGRKKLEEALQKANSSATVKVWPGVGHAFMNQDSPKYSAETAKEALAEVIAWYQSKF